MAVRNLFLRCNIKRKLVLSSLILFFGIGQLAGRAQTPAVGEAAPAFSLKAPDGSAVSLLGHTKKGPVALIVLRGYPGYQCPFCVKQVHDFIGKADKFDAAGTEVLLIYPGPPADLDQHAREFLAKQNPLPNGIHLVLDPDYTVTNRYGLRWNSPNETAYPAAFLVDRKGTIVFRKISKEHGDRTSAADVLADVHKTAAMPSSH